MVTGCCACQERWWQWRRRIRKTNGRRSSWLPRFRFRTHNLRRDRRASKFPRAKRVIVGVIFRFRGSCRSVSRRSGGYRRCGGRRVSVVGDVGLVGAREAFNFAVRGVVTGCCACQERWWQWRRRIRKANGRRRTTRVVLGTRVLDKFLSQHSHHKK